MLFSLLVYGQTLNAFPNLSSDVGSTIAAQDSRSVRLVSQRKQNGAHCVGGKD